jgi:hypothetical protein
MPHSVTMERPRDQPLIEQEHFLEIPPYAFEEPEPVFFLCESNNVVLYKKKLVYRSGRNV